MTEIALSAQGLTKRFGGVVAVSDASLEVPAGATLGVIGPNGAGKSTLLGMLAGSIRPSAGRIQFEGSDVTGEKTHALCRRGLARTYQLSRPLGELTVEGNLRVAAHFGGGAEADVGEVLELCGLAHQRDTLGSDLMHGDQRRLEFARALATRPSLMLLDEVGAGLREREVAAFRELIATVQSRGISLIVVEHIMSLVMRVSHRVLVIESGRIIAEGVPDEVANDPAVIDAYLGSEYAA